jgi:hypothetical protein
MLLLLDRLLEPDIHRHTLLLSHSTFASKVVDCSFHRALPLPRATPAPPSSSLTALLPPLVVFPVSLKRPDKFFGVLTHTTDEKSLQRSKYPASLSSCTKIIFNSCDEPRAGLIRPNAWDGTRTHPPAFALRIRDFRLGAPAPALFSLQSRHPGRPKSRSIYLYTYI